MFLYCLKHLYMNKKGWKGQCMIVFDRFLKSSQNVQNNIGLCPGALISNFGIIKTPPNLHEYIKTPINPTHRLSFLQTSICMFFDSSYINNIRSRGEPSFFLISPARYSMFVRAVQGLIGPKIRQNNSAFNYSLFSLVF